MEATLKAIWDTIHLKALSQQECNLKNAVHIQSSTYVCTVRLALTGHDLF